MHVPSSFHHIFSLLHLKKTSNSLSGELVICRELLVCCGAAPGVSVLEVQVGALTLILQGLSLQSCDPFGVNKSIFAATVVYL